MRVILYFYSVCVILYSAKAADDVRDKLGLTEAYLEQLVSTNDLAIYNCRAAAQDHVRGMISWTVMENTCYLRTDMNTLAGWLTRLDNYITGKKSSFDKGQNGDVSEKLNSLYSSHERYRKKMENFLLDFIMVSKSRDTLTESEEVVVAAFAGYRTAILDSLRTLIHRGMELFAMIHDNNGNRIVRIPLETSPHTS
ncbi:hypothetical protein HDE_04443 [Halotydeus destructor]|nr:hypothetical protein HDE_04443 [Halotydeus destructor]